MRGVQVAENSPEELSTGVRVSGGSPFEKRAVTCAFGTGWPQSSSTRTSSGAGQPMDCWKLSNKPTWVGTSEVATQEAWAWGFEEEEDEAREVEPMMSVMFTVRTAAAENA